MTPQHFFDDNVDDESFLGDISALEVPYHTLFIHLDTYVYVMNIKAQRSVNAKLT